MLALTLLLASLGVLTEGNKVQQVHLSLDNSPDHMVVTWLTEHPLPNVIPFAMYGTSTGQLTSTVKASTTKWEDGGKKAKTRYTYRTTFTDLKPGTRYYYTVGSAEEMSKTFSFIQPDQSKPLRAAIYGDMSILNGYSIQPLIEAATNGEIDVIFHMGDFAYDLDDKNGDTGDDFMNAIEPYTSIVPFMVLPGNHDTAQKYLHYKNRFSTPENGENHGRYWSLDYGNTHIIALNTEFYAEADSTKAEEQYNWLEADLKNNKGKWTVVMMHRPMYCSNDSKKGCHNQEDTITREGAPGFPGLEKLFDKEGVDFIYYAHKHTYERFWPMVKGDPFKTGDPNSFHNAPAPIYVMAGTGGCHDHIFPNETIQQPYSLKQLGNYGYATLRVFNETFAVGGFVDALSKADLDPFVVSKEIGFKR
ncbi:unnamed protein product [Caenorhabditis auriculariae]|uniref:Purple acid phosphatase n=1 Tax=Caenorhabditis auriculariae TaxID=2777116 RepID=A0A8S1HT84_9PELO|nr:unnamed protein product [Caenorhabditis auriculariae]